LTTIFYRTSKERYKLRRKWGWDPHQVPAKEERMSIITEPLRIKYLRCSFPSILESRMISKNFTEVVFGTGNPKIRDGKLGIVFFLVKVIHLDFSGEKTKPLFFKKSEMWYNEVWTDKNASKGLLEVE